MERRIFGLENEYGVTCTLRGQRRLSPDEVARYLFRRVVRWGRSSNVFLAERRPALPRRRLAPRVRHARVRQRSTTSSSTTRPASASSRACSLAPSSASARRASAATSTCSRTTPTRRATRYGCHENYLTSPAATTFAHYAEVLIPFLVTPADLQPAPARCCRPPRGPIYSIAQRAEHIWEGVSSATTRSRPIINTRDEPHADAERYRRLHVIVGDSNMSEYTTLRSKVGAAACMLRDAGGPGVVLRDMTPGEPDPGDPRHQPRHDLPAQGPPGQRPGGQSALDIQREYLDRALRYADTKGLPPLRAAGAGDVGALRHQAAENDPIRSSTGRSTGSIKYRLIEGVPGAARPAAVATPRVAARRPPVPRRQPQPRAVLQAAGAGHGRAAVHRLTTSTRPSTRRRRPPGPGCAASSSARPRNASDYTVDWVHLKLNDQAQRTVLCKDPFRSRDERVEQADRVALVASGAGDTRSN